MDRIKKLLYNDLGLRVFFAKKNKKAFLKKKIFSEHWISIKIIETKYAAIDLITTKHLKNRQPFA